MLFKPQIRLFGEAYKGDGPYNEYMCLKCGDESKDKTIKQAVRDHYQGLWEKNNAKTISAK
jgi:hypothetical protein